MTLIPATLREPVVRRAGGRCEYCRLPQETQVATFPVDHVFPSVLGGETSLENLALACPRCNARKWMHTQAEDPLSGELVPFFNPRTQDWHEHFRWREEDQAWIEGTSPTGRATAAWLHLNSSQHVLVRRWLLKIGLHPTS